MAYDEALAERLRVLLASEPGLTEKKMFGGIAYMINGNMAVGIVGNDLMLRVGEARHEEALNMPHARLMDFNGRPMVGMVYVAPPGVATDAELRERVNLALAYVRTMPAKKPKAAATSKKPHRSAR